MNTEKPKRPTCETCAYFEISRLCCKRYAPRPVADPMSENREWIAAWVGTAPREWCGEHPDFAEYLREASIIKSAILCPVCDRVMVCRKEKHTSFGSREYSGYYQKEYTCPNCKETCVRQIKENPRCVR